MQGLQEHMPCIKCYCPVLNNEWVGEWVSYSRIFLGQATFSLCPGLWFGDFICKVGQSDWLILLSLLDFVETGTVIFCPEAVFSGTESTAYTTLIFLHCEAGLSNTRCRRGSLI